MRKLQKVL